MNITPHKNKINKFAHWVTYGNSCDGCKYFVDTTTCNENGTEYDGYCIIKGDNFDDNNCRWVFPFKQIVGNVKKKKHDYYCNHEYDDCGDFFEKQEQKDIKMEELIKRWLGNRVVCWKDEKGNYHETEVSRDDGQMWEIRSDYEDFVYPFERTTLTQEWRKLIIKTFSTALNKIKPYFCK